jgi:hypothetical protein
MFSTVDSMLRDLRYAVRALRREPAFSLTAIVTLALGSGAAVAIFAVVNAVLLRPLPYRDPARVVLIWAAPPDAARTWLSLPELDDLSRDARSFSAVAGMTDLRMNLTGAGEPEEVQIVAASATLFPGAPRQPQRSYDRPPERMKASTRSKISVITASWRLPAIDTRTLKEWSPSGTSKRWALGFSRGSSSLISSAVPN